MVNKELIRSAISKKMPDSDSNLMVNFRNFFLIIFFTQAGVFTTLTSEG